jgi:hypothetical protein
LVANLGGGKLVLQTVLVAPTPVTDGFTRSTRTLERPNTVHFARVRTIARVFHLFSVEVWAFKLWETLSICKARVIRRNAIAGVESGVVVNVVDVDTF